MLKRIIMALLLAAALAGCVVRARPATVRASYVPRCPAGYYYDGYDCHLRYRHYYNYY